MKTKLFLIIISMLAAAPLALPAQSYAAFPLGIAAKAQDMVADNNGNLHLVWVTAINEIRYGRIVPDGSGGFTVTGQQLVVAANAKASSWTRPRMAVRPDGSTVHVVYLESDTQVKHSWRNSSGVWATEYIRNGLKNYAFPSIGVNANGTLHFVAQKWPGPIVYAKKLVGGSWTTTDIALTDTAVEYRDCAMFTDPAGGVHATWHAGNRAGYYRYAPQGTDLSAVSTMEIPRREGVSTNSFGDLFVRSDGQVHTAFATWGVEQATIDHSYRNSGGSFQTPTCASGGTIDNDDRDCWPALAADATRVYVAWAESYNGSYFTQMKLAVKEGGSWTRYDVDPAAAVYSYSKPVMAITASGLFGVWRSNSFASGQLVLGAILAAPTVTVTAPNGGESWAATTAHSITWDTTGILAGVNIDYSTNDGTDWTRVVSGTANDGEYSWTVPDVLSSSCRVRVSDTDGDPGDASDASFAITAAPAETVSAPSVPVGPSAGGPGIRYAFTAGGAASSQGHDIQYKFSWGDGSEGEWLAVGTTQDTHSWDAVGTYEVRAMARCAAHPAVESAWSAAKSLSISATPKIVVTAPALGDLWEKRKTYAITWDRPGEQNASVKIKLFNSAGTLILTLTTSTPNDGSYDWLVPGTLATGKYFIRVQTVDNLLRDDSDVFQVIVPRIIITSPTATSVWLKGTNGTITWTRIGTMDPNVKIQLFLDSVKKLDITTGTENDGSYDWAIPATLAAGWYNVRVITLDGKVTGKSAEFKIANGRITVTAPTAGVKWQRGLTYDITWTSEGAVNANVKIRLYQGTTLLTTLVATTPNDGAWRWTIPARQALATNYIIRVIAVDNLVTGISPKFSIVSTAALAVTAPNSGEVLKAAQPVRIRWTRDPDVLDVKLEYSPDNGGTFATIAEHAANSGEYAWQAPVRFGRNGIVRVSDANGRPWQDEGLLEVELAFRLRADGDEPALALWFGGSAPRDPGYGFARLEIGGGALRFGGLSYPIASLADGLHGLRLRFDFRRDTLEALLDERPLFAGAPLGTTREFRFRPQLVLQAGGAAAAELLLSDLAVRVVLPDEAGGEPEAFTVLHDDFERYDAGRARGNALESCWRLAPAEAEQGRVRVEAAGPADQALRVASEAGRTLRIALPFSLPGTVPFDVSDQCFTIDN